MSRVTPEYLAAEFRRKLRRKLTRSATLDDVIDSLMDCVPLAAYETPSLVDNGIVRFCDDVDGMTADDLTGNLWGAHLALPEGEHITLYISSSGGELAAGLAIISAMHEIRRKGRVLNTVIQGSAMSMASFIAQAGTKRMIEPYAVMMLHNIGYGVSGARLDSHEDSLEGSKKETDGAFRIYSQATGKPIEYWKEKLNRRDWYLSAQEALEENLVDEILAIP